MEIKYIDNLTDLSPAADELLAVEVVGGDIESTSLSAHDGEMTLLQLAPNPEKAFVFNVRELNDPNDFAFFKNILASKRVVCFQNGKFDLQFITKFFNDGPLQVENFYDSMIISKLLARGDKRQRHGLKDIAARELNMTLDKSLQKSNFGAAEFSEEQIQYAGHDAAVLLGIRESQKAKAEGWQLEKVCRLESDCVPALADVELGGIYLDPEEWSQRCREQLLRTKELEIEIKKILAPVTPIIDLWGDPIINLDAPAQVGKALRDMGVPIGLSTKEEDLVPHREKHHVVELLLEYRKLAKALSSYGDNILEFVHSVTGRIHPDYQQIEAPSGRMSIRKPALQTIPAEEEYRRCFKVQNGGHIIKADYSQIELRIMAKQSGDPVLVQAYMNGDDLHNVTAIKVLGEDPNNIDPMRRRIAKNVNFGTAYGVSPIGFAVTAGVTVKFAEKTLDAYWKVYNVLGAYLRSQADIAEHQQRMQTSSGRLGVLYFDQNDKQKCAAARRLGRNFGVQGTGADILKRALYLLRNQFILNNIDGSVVNVVHDEIVVETRDDPEYVSGIMKKVMMEAAEEYLLPIPCVVDVKIGATW